MTLSLAITFSGYFLNLVLFLSLKLPLIGYYHILVRTLSLKGFLFKILKIFALRTFGYFLILVRTLSLAKKARGSICLAF